MTSKLDFGHAVVCFICDWEQWGCFGETLFNHWCQGPANGWLGQRPFETHAAFSLAGVLGFQAQCDCVAAPMGHHLARLTNCQFVHCITWPHVCAQRTGNMLVSKATLSMFCQPCRTNWCEKKFARGGHGQAMCHGFVECRCIAPGAFFIVRILFRGLLFGVRSSRDARLQSHRVTGCDSVHL